MIKWLIEIFTSKDYEEEKKLLEESNEELELKIAQSKQDMEDIRLELKAERAGFKMYQEWCEYQFSEPARIKRKLGEEWPSRLMLCDLGICTITEHYPAKSKHDTESLVTIASEVCKKYQEEFKVEYGNYFKL